MAVLAAVWGSSAGSIVLSSGEQHANYLPTLEPPGEAKIWQGSGVTAVAGLARPFLDRLSEFRCSFHKQMGETMKTLHKASFVRATAVLLLVFVAAILLTSTQSATATFPGGNGDIAYACGTRKDENFQICYGDKGVLATYKGLSDLNEPAYSPDGKYLLFTASNGYGRQIYIIPREHLDWGAKPLVCYMENVKEPTWSPGGLAIAWVSNVDGDDEIYMDYLGPDPYHRGDACEGGGTWSHKLTDNNAGDESPSWSPDGLKIAFDSDRDGSRAIYIMNADGSNVTQLTNVAEQDKEPDWSPDGKQIAFSRKWDPPGIWKARWRIYAMNADGSNQHRVEEEKAYDAEDPAWSPSGDAIAYTTDGKRITVYRFGEKEPRNWYIVGHNRRPTWQPLPSPCAAVEDNLVSNFCFDEGRAPWQYWHNDHQGYYDVSTSNSFAGEHAAKIAAGVPGKNVQFYQAGLALQPKTTYELSFAAYSNDGRDMRVYVHRHNHDATYTNYGLRGERVNLERHWQVFTMTFTTPNLSNMNDARLRFWLAPFAQAGTVYHIDHVVLRPLP